MSKYLKSLNTLSIITGILTLLLGITLLFVPMQSLVWIAIAVGVMLLINGVMSLVSFFSTPKAERTIWSAVRSILTVLMGLWMVFGSGVHALQVLVPYVFAGLVLVAGVIQIDDALATRRRGNGAWGWVLALGILEAIFGFSLIFMPLLSATLVSFLLAMVLISYGAGNLVTAISVRRISRKAKRWIRDQAEQIRADIEQDAAPGEAYDSYEIK